MTILHWTKIGSSLLALAVAASGAGLIAQDRGGKPVDGPKPAATPDEAPPTVEVRPGKLGFALSSRGAVEPARPHDVLSDVERQVAVIRILPDGSKVQAGDVVAELDSSGLRDDLTNQRIKTSEAEAAFRRARLSREVAEYAVKEYVEGVAPQDLASFRNKINQAEAGMVRGRARLDRAGRARDRLKDAAKNRVGPESAADVLADLLVADQLDAAEAGLEAGQRDLDGARLDLHQFEHYTRGKQTKDLQRDVEKLRAEELSTEASWKLEQARLAKLERQIKNCVLPAPVDGLLVLGEDPSARSLEPLGPSAPSRSTSIGEGATVRERQKVFTVVNPADPMRVNARVPESWVAQVREGTAVRVSTPARPGESFAGVVRAIAGRADEAVARAEGVKIYPTVVQLGPDAANKLRPGMRAEVEIPIFDLDGVLSVPTGAVVTGDGGDWVMVQAPGGAEWRKITPGRANDRDVEVKEGLRPGDRVLLKPPAPAGGRDATPARPKAPQ